MHFPLFYNVITIGFLAKVPRNFARKYGSWFEQLGIFVNVFVKSLFEMTRTFPKFNGIVLTFIEEKS